MIGSHVWTSAASSNAALRVTGVTFGYPRDSVTSCSSLQLHSLLPHIVSPSRIQHQPTTPISVQNVSHACGGAWERHAPKDKT